ncbi:TPA: hypothetical protein NJ081_003268 [Vibrio parahaemolyticus]|nr:hypothetical protein [Vibrio parahaemolyticus]
MNNKMEKRLSWIKPTDLRQAKWIANYVIKKMWVARLYEGETPQQVVERFISMATNSEENPATREQCRNLKAAWTIWDKRNQPKNKVIEGTYTISLTARKELERLAKREKCSLSHVIETTLLNAKNIERQTKELQRIVENARPGTVIDTNYIRMLFNKDVFIKQFDSITLQHEIDELKSRLSELQANQQEEEQWRPIMM